MFKSLRSLESRVQAGFVSALVLILACGGFGYSGLRSLASAVSWVEHTSEVLERLTDAHAAAAEAGASARAYALTGEVGYRNRAFAARERTRGALAEVRLLTGDNDGQQRRLWRLEAVTRHVNDVQMGNALPTSALRGPSARPEFLQHDRAMQDTLDAAFASMIAEERRLMIRREASQLQEANHTNNMLALLSALAVGFVMIGLWVSRQAFRFRAATERRIRMSEEKYRHLVERSPSAVLIFREGKVAFANLAASVMIGAAGGHDLIGVPAVLLFPGGDPARGLHGSPPEGVAVVELARLDGATRRVACTTVPFEDDGGGLQLLLRDVTVEEQAAEAMARARDAALSSSQAKSAFLARMSHELRTPLNSILGFTNIVRAGAAERLTEKERMYLDRVRKNGEHLLEVINEILDIARIEARKVSLERERTDLGSLLRSTMQLLEGRLVDRPELRLEVSIPSVTTPIVTDAVKLRQVVINLVGNALKFTERGYVRLELECSPTGEPRFLRVRDTGPGIPPDHLAVIFEAFEQGDGALSRKHEGTGLGLSIARALADLLGYRLLVESRVGEGSVFTVDLMATDAAPDPRV